MLDQMISYFNDSHDFQENIRNGEFEPYSCFLDVLFSDNTVQRYGLIDDLQLLIGKNQKCNFEDILFDKFGNSRIKIALFNSLDSEIPNLSMMKRVYNSKLF
jgi:hypothetical protein